MSWTLETTTPATDGIRSATGVCEQTQLNAKLISDATVSPTNQDAVACGVQGAGQFRDNYTAKAVYPEIQPVTIFKNGGTVTIDEFDRVTQMQDASHRVFQFGYDKKSGDLNQVTNLDGTWQRQSQEGKYTDQWVNQSGQTWKGSVEVTPDSYSFTRDNQKIAYTPDGKESKEYLSSGKAYYTDTAMPDGKHQIMDSRLNGQSGKETTFYDDKNKTIKSIIDHSNNSQLTYDEQGHLTAFRDARGKTVSFEDYDDQGNPHTLENQKGVWHKTGQDLWTNDATSKSLHVHIQVNKDGYTFDEQNGNVVTRHADGSTVENYKGIKTTIDARGKTTQELADGSLLAGDTVKGSLDFSVKKGDTKSAHIQIAGRDLEIVHAKGGDIHAHVEAAPKAPVGALQDGLVVYSYNHDAKTAGKIDQRATSVIGLSENDMAVINQIRRGSGDRDLVVLQCYDKASKGVRYEIYAGLNLANAAPGDRIKAGSVLGTAGDNGYTFAARKGAVAGHAIELTL